jgi:hypothetical protein
MGWFSKQKEKCKECGREICITGRDFTFDDIKDLSEKEFESKFPIEDSYACLLDGMLHTHQRGSIDSQALVLCCGTCSRNARIVAKYLKLHRSKWSTNIITYDQRLGLMYLSEISQAANS